MSKHIATGLFAVLLFATSLSAQRSGGPTVVVVTDPERGAMVRWPLPERAYPAGGFQLDRIAAGGARQLVAIVKPGVAPEGGTLAPEKARFAADYIRLAANPAVATDPKLKDEFAQTRLVVELMSLYDPLFAKTLGIAYEDRPAPQNGTLVHEVLALNASGRPSGTYAISPPTPFVAMPPPAPPADFRGVATREGVGLFWSPPSKEERNPAAAVSYEVRKSSTVLTPEPVLRMSGSGETEEAPGVVDPKPAIETTITYTIVSLDIFGRRGPASAPLEVFYPDYSALDPPTGIAESTSDGKALLTWTAPANRNRKGWKIVRALQPEAVGDPAQIVSGMSFTDTTTSVGTTYYYRISAINQRGEAGLPNTSQAILVRSGKPPAAPTKLEAKIKTGKIILTWEGGPETVAGYQVERSIEGSNWSLMNRVVSSEPRYDDVYPRDATGTLRYRVIAWSYDDTPSQPSAVLTVPLPDTSPPLAPLVEAIDGAEGKVAVQFAPGGAADGDVARFYVLRSLTPKDPGIVLQPEGLGATARSFVDADVEAGVTYFYRLVAVDAAGNRSAPTDPPAAVHVGAPPLPAPPLPKAHFEAKPFPRVVFEFPPSSSPSVRYALERRDTAGRWVMIQGPFAQEAGSAMDATPPRNGTAVYRFVTLSTNGGSGPRSAEVSVTIP